MSILKYSVPEFIANNNNLMDIIYEIKDATIEDGGSGTFYIFLKKNKFTKFSNVIFNFSYHERLNFNQQ